MRRHICRHICDFIMSKLKLCNHCSIAVSAVDMYAKYFIKWYQVQTVHLLCGKVDLFLQLSSSHVCLDAVHKVNDPCVNCSSDHGGHACL